MKPQLLSFAVALAATAASAQETRELDAHVHGHGTLNMAFEGQKIALELEVPGADIVGFEHAAESAEDRAKIEEAIAALAKPLSLFVFSGEAECVVTEARAALVMGGEAHDDEHEEHEHEEEHEEAGHDEEHEHEEAHHDEGEGETHSEFHAEYLLTCADPGKVTGLDFAYFAQFPNAEELDVQLISDQGSKGFEVERDEPVLDLAGLI